MSSENSDSKYSTGTDVEETSKPTNNGDEEKERAILSKRENRAVALSRALVFVVLSIVAYVISSWAYRYTREDQVSDFENEYSAHAQRLIQSFHRGIQDKIEAADALSVAITSNALASGANFPNVSLPDFNIRAANTRVLADTMVTNYHSIVTEDERAGWEEWMRANRNEYLAAIGEGFYQRAVQDSRFEESSDDIDVNVDESDRRELQDLPPFRDTITGYYGTYDGAVPPPPDYEGPYLPVWHQSPAVPAPHIIGFDSFSHPAGKGANLAVVSSKQAVIDVSVTQHNEGTRAYYNLLLSMSQYRYSSGELIEDPTSSFGYPVFDSFNHTKREVKGLLSMIFYWRLLLEDILPPNAVGIVLILENTLGQTLTFRIDGTEATFVGEGDLHDTKFDDMVFKGNFASFLATRRSPRSSSYTSVGLNTEYCDYSIRVYPSQDTQDRFVNRSPLILMVAMLCVFGFTSLVFVTYDLLVARRQRIVMNQALLSGAIVSSLFPEQVRDQLYQEKKQESNKDKAWASKEHEPSMAFMNLEDDDNAYQKAQIASLYPNTTIMFADLAGFTKWSSTREPAEVFNLLESLYGSFDRLANRRKVFKVETIGDCYVAATGLPNPQPDHAVIMTKFAKDCMAKMTHVTERLSHKLGDDTKDLRMRVGLHSGPVTGGVLRGEKARFQLFGDTMNTASRMESNGEKGKIHCSAETATVLRAHGKDTWLVPREDKIIAKGKGELQTFWVQVTDRGSHSIVSSTDRSVSPRHVKQTVGDELLGNMNNESDDGEDNSNHVHELEEHSNAEVASIDFDDDDNETLQTYQTLDTAYA